MLGWLSLVIAGIVCSALLALLLQHAPRLPLDHPNERSLHDRPIPRIGGLGLVPGLLIGWACTGAFSQELLLIAGVTLALAIISAVDDRQGLPVSIRLSAHLSAGLLTAAVITGDFGWQTVLCAGLVITWITNLYNFMDGANGLAGGMAVFGFAAYGIAATAAGNHSLAALSFATAGAALGFLLFNFDPARLFLGDAGSIPLGFLAAALGLAGIMNTDWPSWFPLLVFSPFILDASVTLALRLLQGEPIWLAHRNHYYQRLIRLGWSHRRLALAEYGLMLATGLCALWLRDADTKTQWFALSGWLATYVLLALTINRHWKRHTEVSA